MTTRHSGNLRPSGDYQIKVVTKGCWPILQDSKRIANTGSGHRKASATVERWFGAGSKVIWSGKHCAGLNGMGTWLPVEVSSAHCSVLTPAVATDSGRWCTTKVTSQWSDSGIVQVAILTVLLRALRGWCQSSYSLYSDDQALVKWWKGGHSDMKQQDIVASCILLKSRWQGITNRHYTAGKRIARSFDLSDCEPKGYVCDNHGAQEL